MTSYITLLSKIEQFCNAHLQIKKYGGEFREQMPNFSTKDEKYPIIFVEPVSDLEDLNTNQFSINVYCVDIIQKDRANLNTIVSDCQLILKDMYVYYTNDMDAQLDVVGTSTMTPINNFDLDYVAGWVMSITFEVSSYGPCEIPMNPITPTPVECLPGTVQNSDLTYSTGVPSGGLVVLPDVRLQVFDQNENLLSDAMYPSVRDEQITITIEDVHVQNSDDSYTQIVHSGDTLQLPDITIEVVDQNSNVLSSGTYPSVQNETIGIYIEPCADTTYRIADTHDATLYQDHIPSGGHADITITDSFISNSNDTYTNSVAAQQTLELPDVTFSINNTLGTQVLSTTVPSVTNQTLVAPDGVVHIKHEADGTIANVSTPSGATTEYIIQNNDITVNAANPFIIHAEEPLDIRLKNQSGGTISPSTVSYNGNQHYVDVTINTSSFVPVGATLQKTGQTTSFATADDGATQRGRLTNFTTLPSNNPHGNTNRFTNKTGGQGYGQNVAIDWSTYNGSTVLAYYFGDSTTRTWAAQLTQYTNSTIDGLTGWNLFNIYEAMNIMNFSFPGGFVYNYAPFNLTRRYMFVSTNQTGTNAISTETAGPNPFTTVQKASSLWGIWVRVCTVTGTTIS